MIYCSVPRTMNTNARSLINTMLYHSSERPCDEKAKVWREN